MNDIIKRSIYPVRKFLARFVDIGIIGSDDIIVQKAANIMAAEKVEGDYLEFGVFAGSSFIRSYKIIKNVFEQHQKINAGRTGTDAAEIKKIWDKMRFFAFDSFQGLPEISGCDIQTSDFSEGKWASTEKVFMKNIDMAGIPAEKVVTVAGWFEETCKNETRLKLNMKKASIVNIDCDLYASAKAALNFVGPLLTDGTVIVFDDWYCFRGNPKLGEQRAFNEWRETMVGWIFTEYQKEGPWKNSFIASRVDV